MKLTRKDTFSPLPACGLLLLFITGWLSLTYWLPVSHPWMQKLMPALAAKPLARSQGGVNATTDRYLLSLDLAEPSETIRQEIASLPREDGLLVITPDEQTSTDLIYRTIAYLSWPREVGAYVCGQPPLVMFAPRTETRVRWLLLYQLKPTPAQTAQARTIGPHLTLLPLTESNQWTTYCSQ